MPKILLTVPRTPPLAAVNTQRCTGCGWCVAACPLHLLSLAVVNGRKTSVLAQADTCTGCTKCEARCPFGVITMVPRPDPGHTAQP